MKKFTLALVLAAAFSVCSLTVRAQSIFRDSDDLWGAYKQRFISADGRLIDDSAQDVSHSEGQGYAMLLAQFAGDREAFDKLWTWTAANLQVRPDALLSWRWRPNDNPHVLDKNNATDGDLLVAWALAEAGKRWQDSHYDSEAERIAQSIWAKASYRSIFGVMLSPGAYGFGPNDGEDGPVVNLSYWVFPAFDALQRVAPSHDWAGLRRGGLALLDAAKFGPRKLPSDWISLKSGVHPADAYPKQFSYDAVRAPLYLAWGQPKETGRLTSLIDGWTNAGEGAPSVIDVETGEAKEKFADAGYRAVAALARCAAHGEAFPADLRTVDLRRYYPATLQMLALTALREGRFEC